MENHINIDDLGVPQFQENPEFIRLFLSTIPCQSFILMTTILSKKNTCHWGLIKINACSAYLFDFFIHNLRLMSSLCRHSILCLNILNKSCISTDRSQHFFSLVVGILPLTSSTFDLIQSSRLFLEVKPSRCVCLLIAPINQCDISIKKHHPTWQVGTVVIPHW